MLLQVYSLRQPVHLEHDLTDGQKINGLLSMWSAELCNQLEASLALCVQGQTYVD